MVCPNFNTPEWKALSSYFGEDNAYNIFLSQDNELPTLDVIRRMSIVENLKAIYDNNVEFSQLGETTKLLDFINERYKDTDIQIVFKPEKIKDELYSLGTTYFTNYQQAVAHSDNSAIKAYVINLDSEGLSSVDFQEDIDDLNLLRGSEVKYLLESSDKNSINIITTQDPTYQEDTDSQVIVTKGNPQVEEITGSEFFKSFDEFVQAEEERVREEAPKFSLKKDELRIYDIITNNLRDKKILHRYKGKIYVTGSNPDQRSVSISVLNKNILRLKNYLLFNNINPDLVTVDLNTGIVSFGRDADMTVNEAHFKKPTLAVSNIIAHFTTIFSNLKVEVVSVKEAEEILGEANKAYKVDNNSVKGFYYKGTSYLIKGRYDADTAAEELLHPFVDALFQDNNDLFQNLYKEATETYPALFQEVLSEYTTARGFTADDVAIEFLTKSLSRTYIRGALKQAPKRWIERISQFKEWLFDSIKRIYEAVAGKVFPLKVQELKPSMTISNVLNLLHTTDIVFDFKSIKDEQLRFNLDPEFAEKYKKNATTEQKVVIDKLVNAPAKVKLNEAAHVYEDQDGTTYKSVTTAIKGKLSEELGENEISRLVGKDFDQILEDIINGKTFDQIAPQEVKNNELIKKFYDNMSNYISGLQADGSIVLAQVAVADPNKEYYLEEDRYPIAGSIDILVVSPEGIARVIDLKVSKNSTTAKTVDNKVVDSPSYVRSYPIKKRKASEEEDPKIINSDLKTDASLSTKNQHGIQVNIYSKLLEVIGIPTQVPTTVNIKLDGEFFFVKDKAKYAEKFNERGEKIFTKNDVQIERKDYILARKEYLEASSDNKLKADIKDVIWETEREHKLFDNQIYVDNIILSRRAVNDFKDSLNAEEQQVEEESEDVTNRIIEFVSDFAIPSLEKRQEVLKMIMGSSNVFKPKVETIDRIGTIINVLRDEVVKSPVAAFGSFLRAAQKDIQDFADWATNPANLRMDKSASVIINFGKFLNTYNELKNFVSKMENNPAQQKMLRETLNLINEVGNPIYQQALEDAVMNIVGQENIRDLSQEDLVSIVSLNEEYTLDDISGSDLFLGDIDTSPDVLLATVGRIYKKALFDIENAVDKSIKEARIYANALSEAQGGGRPDYSFMIDDNGRYVRRLGKQYFDIKRELEKNIRDEDGKMLKYIEGDELTDEEKAFNIDLYNKKQAYNEFSKAEIYRDGKVIQGNFQTYTDEFLRAREKFEVLQNGQWVPRSDVSQVDIARYRAKYFNYVEGYNKMERVKGELTGNVEKANAYFPKPEYITARDVTLDGRSMMNSRYEAIMNDNSTLGKARRDWYNFWIREHDEGSLSKLTDSDRRMMRGRLPVIEKRFSQKLAQKPHSVGILVLKGLRNFFNFKSQRANRTIIKEVITDETGENSLRRVPVYYMGGLKNQERIDELKEKRNKIKQEYADSSKNRQDYQNYKKALIDIENKITIEESKVKEEELNDDLFESFVLFRRMAENFEKMSAIEDKVLSIGSIIEEKKYAANPNLVIDKMSSINPSSKIKYSQGNMQSRVSRRFQKWLDMVFYNTTKYQKTDAQYITEKLMSLMSFQYVGLNIFGNVHNFIFGKISNNIETIGGRFYDRRAAMRANKESINFLAGYSQKAFSKKDGFYNYKKPMSKYEAVAAYFRMIRDKDSGLSYDHMPGIAYAGQRAGEYLLQSKTGISYVMSRQIKHSQTGETKSLYDAFNFNPNTGELTLQEGFEFSEKDRFNITNYIWEMNKEIHGNYAWEDRMVIQDNFLGQLVAQFHKWVYPAYKARFKKRRMDANLGDMEGRYVSLVEFYKYLRETGFTGFSESWDMLDDIQKSNMMRNLGEASMMAMSFILFTVLSKLSEGEDDEEVKRLINVFAYDFNRTSKELLTWVPVVGVPELWQMVKNPVAITRYLGELSDVVEAGIAFPFQEEEERYYSRGVNKDELKLSKQFKDIIPLWYQAQRWKSYVNTTNFYIK